MSIEQAIKDSDAQFAETLARGDMEAFGALHTEDTLLLPPNAPQLSGRQAVVSFYKEFVEAGYKNFSFSSVQVSSDGDLAYNVGRYSADVATDGGTTTDSGKFVDVYKRQSDGSWKIHVSIFNSDTPLPE